MGTPWDARTYDESSQPQQAWASDVLARLEGIGDNGTILDVGCGTGRVTELLLALVSQVVGWLLIATALPRLPMLETSVMLLGQPVLAVIWGVLFFAETLSPLQWVGAVVVLAGVAAMTTRTRLTTNA